MNDESAEYPLHNDDATGSLLSELIIAGRCAVMVQYFTY